MKTLKDFYEEKKRLAHILPSAVYNFSKPKYREPTDGKQQETLNNYIKQIYNPKIKKLREQDYFREEWIEPDNKAKT